MSFHTDENDNSLCEGKCNREHEPHSDFIRTAILRQTMKGRVLKELTPTNAIYEEGITNAELEGNTVAALPTNREIYEYRLINLLSVKLFYFMHKSNRCESVS